MAASINRREVCFFCKDAEAKYLCPKCEYHYCSVNCYNSREHIQCTESFYEECVRSFIKNEEKSEDSKIKMLEALKRLKETYDESSDEDNETNPSLQERIKNVNLSGDPSAEEIWDRLTEKEKEEFKKLIDSGEAVKLVPDWQPWWMAEEEDKIVDITHGDSSCNSQSSLCLNVKPLSLLTSKLPSNCIKYNFLNILCAYVYAVKIHWGSHHDFPEEAADAVLYLSPILHTAVNFQSAGEAVQYCIQKLTTEQTQWTLNRDAAVVLIRDVSKVVATAKKSKMRKSVFYAIEDLYSLFKETKHLLKQASKKKQEVSSSIQVTTKALKKLEYYMSWLLEYQMSLLELIPDLETEYACAIANHLPPGKPDIKKQPLIQELDTDEKRGSGWEELD